MIVLHWAPYPGADVASYKLCRSMIGFSALKPSPLATINGLTLQLKFNGGATQTITFNGTTPVIDQINAVIPNSAYDCVLDTANFIVRSNVREAPGSVQIVGGTALALLGLTARTITEKSEEELIATIPALVDPTQVVSFEDPDGVPEDYYRLSTVSSLNVESTKTTYQQAISFSGSVCVIEGIVSNLQGIRLCDVEVSAHIIKMPQNSSCAFVSKDIITVLTGSDGRFSLALLQGAVVEIKIPSIGLSRNLCVPATPFAFLKDIPDGTDNVYQY